MKSNNHYPRDLAKLVKAQLRLKYVKSPTVLALTRLFETMYFASLKTEESQPILCTLTYIDPDNPDPDPPSRIVADRWSYVRFDQRIPLDVGNLVKVSKAVDPSASSLAVYSDRHDQLFIWGMIDQALHYHNFINRESEEGPERPGDFQAAITGIGNISVYKDYSLIGSLKQNVLVREYHDVLWSGPVHKILESYIRNYIVHAKAAVGNEIYDQRDHWKISLTADWLDTLCRIFLHIQRYQHGGAILIVPYDSFDGLNVKYKIYYDRLHRALKKAAEKKIFRCYTEDYIFENYLGKSQNEMPVELYLDKSVYSNEEKDTLDEIAGCVCFISSLSCVDGLVLIDRDLVVKGFGVEITIKNEPKNVFIAGDSLGTSKLLRKVDFNHFGTRHRSMMRYCFQHEGSVGFVISQDGDIRAMTKVSKKLVLWENIKIRLAFDT